MLLVLIISSCVLYHLATLVTRLQKVQNSAARLLTNTSKQQHITPVLKKLHWLPVIQRVKYKIIIQTYKCIYNEDPSYLSDRIIVCNTNRTTRYSSAPSLITPRYRCVTLGARSFSVAGPSLWNSLPVRLHS